MNETEYLAALREHAVKPFPNARHPEVSHAAPLLHEKRSSFLEGVAAALGRDFHRDWQAATSGAPSERGAR